MLRMGAGAGMELLELLRQMNAGLCDRLPAGRFVCAFIGELDMRTHRLRYAAAGMAPILIMRAQGGAIESQGATMPPLGLDEPIDETCLAERDLGSGDALIVATDGVHEQPDAKGKRLGGAGVEAVLELVRARGGVDADAVMGGIRTSLAALARGVVQEDDQTVVVVVRNAVE